MNGITSLGSVHFCFTKHVYVFTKQLRSKENWFPLVSRDDVGMNLASAQA